MHAIHATNSVDRTLEFYTQVFGVKGQVQAFAKAHWQGQQLRGVIAGDLKAAGDSLKPLGDKVRRVAIEALAFEQPSLAKPAK